MSLAHAAPRAAPQRLGSTSGLRARPGGNAARVSRAVRAQAATPGGHNHRPSSPQKPRPSAPNLRRVVDGASSPATAQAQAQGTSVEKGPDPSRSTPRAATRTRAAASTTAGFQRTSWYGAVSSAIPGVGVVARASPDAGAGPGPGGSGVNINPTVVKQGSGSNPAAAPKPTPAAATKTEPKPFKDPSAGGGELALPRESDKANKRKPAGLTRLLRTPLSGGVLNSMKDADLPSVAVAARNLMELADYADLSTIMSNMNHRRSGYPFASTVDFATDADGHPIFCLTPLAMHTRNLAYNSRASLTVKMNGWGGLANARVTIFGDVQRLPPEYQAAANEVFKAKYEARKEDIDLEDRWGDYTFYRMNNVIDVYFVGGFGTLNWVDLKEYRDATPDKIVTPASGSSVLDTLAELNTRYGTRLAKSGAVQGSAAPNEPAGEVFEAKVDDLWIISIDRMGVDVRVRVGGVSQVRRINFMGCVETFTDACEALEAIISGRTWEGGSCDDA